MKILLASDHAGFELKNILKEYISNELKLNVDDRGAFVMNSEDNFTDILAPVAYDMSKASFSEAKDSASTRAIVIGGSGQGEAMIMNRFPGVRAAVYYGGDEKIITLSREHNDANVLALGARFLSVDEAKKAVKLWLSTDFSGEPKYARRNASLDEME